MLIVNELNSPRGPQKPREKEKKKERKMEEGGSEWEEGSGKKEKEWGEGRINRDIHKRHGGGGRQKKPREEGREGAKAGGVER